MKYYKIIQNEQVIGAGIRFLKWYTNKHQFFYCDISEAERVQDIITETLYQADWLKKSPSDALQSEEADVQLITATEYDEIVALLNGGEEIPVIPEPDPIPEPVPEESDTHIMTIQEMREVIINLTSMSAKTDISQGEYFVLHDEIYQATDPIEKGSLINPGTNCRKTTL